MKTWILLSSLLFGVVSCSELSHLTQEEILNQTRPPTPTASPTPLTLPPTPTATPTIESPSPTATPVVESEVMLAKLLCPNFNDGRRGGDLALKSNTQDKFKVVLSYKLWRSWAVTQKDFEKLIGVELVGGKGFVRCGGLAWANPEDVAKKQFRAHFDCGRPRVVESTTGTKKPHLVLKRLGRMVCNTPLKSDVHGRSD